MSYLSESTDKKVLAGCAKAIKELDQVSFCGQTKEDDQSYTTARNALFCIIDSNGYEMDCSTYKIKKVSK